MEKCLEEIIDLARKEVQTLMKNENPASKDIENSFFLLDIMGRCQDKLPDHYEQKDDKGC